MSALYGNVGAKLVSLRRSFGDSQTAVLMLQSAFAKRLCMLGRLRVGLVYARVRPTELPQRCFKCLAFGHVLRDCLGTDRSNCCRRCGGVGHLRQGCTANQGQAKTFRTSLSGRTSRDITPIVHSTGNVNGATTHETDLTGPSKSVAQ